MQIDRLMSILLCNALKKGRWECLVAGQFDE